MLACCDGFGGHENPRFWKRLIDFVTPDPYASIRQHVGFAFGEPGEDVLTDANPFFSTKNKRLPFPRIRLKMTSSPVVDESQPDHPDQGDIDNIRSVADWFRAVVETFAGLCDPIGRRARIHKHASALLPYVNDQRCFEDPLELGVLLSEYFPLRGFSDVIRNLSNDMETNTTLASRRASIAAGDLRFPAVAFKELAIDQVVERATELRNIADIISACELRVPRLNVEPTADDDATQALANFLKRANEPRSHVEMLAIELRVARPRQVEILLSSLPGSNIHTVRICADPLDERTWAWIAYTAYHPQLANGRFQYLDLEQLDISESTAAPMMSSSAAQSALYCHLYGVNDDSVPEGTRQFEDETEVDAVVQYAVQDLQGLPSAVCVVIPSYGHGWVAKDTVDGIERTRVDYATVPGIAFGPLNAAPSMSLRTLAPLLHNVASLNIAAWRGLSAERLLEILRICHHVKNLRLHHRGELFHEWNEETPRGSNALQALALQSLSIVSFDDANAFLSPSATAWKTCLRSVSAMTITTLGPRAMHQQAMQRTLAHGKFVNRFVWNSCDQSGYGTNPTYDGMRTMSREVLDVAEGHNDLAFLPMSVRARLAFASVIHRKAAEHGRRQATRRLRSSKGNSMGKLTPEIARHICAFAATSVERNVWVVNGEV